jgi:hypothetical protein
MSTDYRPIPAIRFSKLFDGRLDKYGIRARAPTNSSPNSWSLVGSDGVLEAYRQLDGNANFSRGSFEPIPWAVIDALTNEFQIELVSEHDHRFWGFASKKEEEDRHNQIAKEYEDDFYKNLVHYLRGEPHNLTSGTIGMQKAEIAKALVATDESLLTPTKRHLLLEGIEAIYDRDHSVKITLTAESLALVELLAARTDELPRLRDVVPSTN